MTEAVCDSGPLTHLWQVGLWRLFGTFEVLHIAAQVAGEVRERVPIEEFGQLAPGCALKSHEVTAEELADLADMGLHEADMATLALARRVTPDLVLTDDLTLRRAVEAQGLVPMGSVGILLRAYKRGLLDAAGLDRAIDGLFVHSTLYLSPTFKEYVRRLIAQMTAGH